MAGAGSVSAQLDNILTEYVDEKAETLEVCLRAAAKDTVQRLRTTSPRGTGPKSGRYAKGWTVKHEKKGLLTSEIVHNKTDYQLTHLLEKSHVIKNQFGTYGRSTPEVHIAPAEEEGERYLLNMLEREL